MSSTVLHLMQLHIVPSSPTLWHRRQIEGDESSPLIEMNTMCPVDREIHIQWIEVRLTSDMWLRVSIHEANAGLGFGEPDLGLTKQAHQKLFGDGLVQQASALEATVTHNAWCAVRANDDRQLQMCSRCGIEPETLLHSYWTCENNAECLHPSVVNTQHIRARAVR